MIPLILLRSFYDLLLSISTYILHSLKLGCRDPYLGGEPLVFPTGNEKIFLRGSLIILLDEDGCPDQNDQRH